MRNGNARASASRFDNSYAAVKLCFCARIHPTAHAHELLQDGRHLLHTRLSPARKAQRLAGRELPLRCPAVDETAHEPITAMLGLKGEQVLPPAQERVPRELWGAEPESEIQREMHRESECMQLWGAVPESEIHREVHRESDACSFGELGLRARYIGRCIGSQNACSFGRPGLRAR
jgi:hypothetical protein